MAREVTRKLTVTADTRGLKQASADLVSFDSQGRKVVDMLKTAKQTMSAVDYQAFAKSMQPAIQAERDMAQMAKAVASELKPFGAEMRKAQTDALKAAEAINKRALAETRAAENLRKAFDTQYASAQKYLGVEAQVQKQVELRNLTVEQGNTILASASKRYGQVSNDAEHASDAVKLTGNQLLNLGRQGGDAATMLAMGSSPLQVLTSQAAQVVDALASGPQGVKGSLQAVGSTIAGLMTPTNLIIGGLTAAAGAAIYFSTRSDSSVKTAELALQSYRTLVDSLQDSYQRAGDAAERYMQRSRVEGPNVALAAIQGTAAEIRATLTQEIDNLYPKTQGFVASFASLTPEVLRGHEAIRRLGNDLNERVITAAQFREQLALIRINPQTPPDIVKIVDGLLASSVNARDLANALGAAGEAAATASGKMGRLKVPAMQDMVAPFGTAIDYMKRLQPDAFDTLTQGLTDQADEMKEAARVAQEARQKVIDEMRQVAEATADRMASYDQRVEMQRMELKLLDESEGASAALPFALVAYEDEKEIAE